MLGRAVAASLRLCFLAQRRAVGGVGRYQCSLGLTHSGEVGVGGLTACPALLQAGALVTAMQP